MRPIRFSSFAHRFTLEGLNLERFVNMLSSRDIPLLAFRRSGPRQMICEAYQGDMPVIRALADEKGWKLLGEEPLRLAAWADFCAGDGEFLWARC